jgi:hypothetical protein
MKTPRDTSRSLQMGRETGAVFGGEGTGLCKTKRQEAAPVLGRGDKAIPSYRAKGGGTEEAPTAKFGISTASRPGRHPAPAAASRRRPRGTAMRVRHKSCNL